MGELDMLFLGGCATRLGNDVGGPFIRASYHTTLDVFRMMGVNSLILIGVGEISVYGCHKVIVDVLVFQRIKKPNLVVVFHFHGEVGSLLLSSSAKEGY